MALYGLSGLWQLLGIQVSAGFLHLAFTQIPVAQCSNNSVLVYIYKIAIAVQHPCVCILPSLCLNSHQCLVSEFHQCLVSEFLVAVPCVWILPSLCLNSHERPCVWILPVLCVWILISSLMSEFYPALCLNSWPWLMSQFIRAYVWILVWLTICSYQVYSEASYGASWENS